MEKPPKKQILVLDKNKDYKPLERFNSEEVNFIYVHDELKYIEKILDNSSKYAAFILNSYDLDLEGPLDLKNIIIKTRSLSEKPIFFKAVFLEKYKQYLHNEGIDSIVHREEHAIQRHKNFGDRAAHLPFYNIFLHKTSDGYDELHQKIKENLAFAYKF